jgi:hypothetical protein
MKNTKLPAIITLMIMTLITTIFWISFNIYRVFKQEADPVVPEEVILQIDPKLDNTTIELIKNKI